MQPSNPKWALNVSPEDVSWASSIVFDNRTAAWCENNPLSVYAFGRYFPPTPDKLQEKIAILNYLNLRNTAPIKILDIGTGTGHFVKLCESLGHSCDASDITSSLEELKDLHSIYNLNIFNLEVKAQTPTLLTSTYDLITTMRTTFDTGDQNDRYFSAEDWNFLIADLLTHLNPNGRIFLKTNLKLHDGPAQTEIVKALGQPLDGWNSYTYLIRKPE